MELDIESILQALEELDGNRNVLLATTHTEIFLFTKALNKLCHCLDKDDPILERSRLTGQRLEECLIRVDPWFAEILDCDWLSCRPEYKGE